MRIVVTGEAGYIGSHTCVELLNAGHTVVVVDNLARGKAEAIVAVENLTRKRVAFHCVDLLDHAALDRIFANPIDAVIHFAALKSVGESITDPMAYYRNNVSGTINLLEAMQRSNCRSLVYSSSCTVYGETKSQPLTENHPTTNAACPYGTTKRIAEQIMLDLSASDPRWRIAIMCYFSPAGAHSSGDLGENPESLHPSLMSSIAQVAAGRRESVSVYGNDYPTDDGTAIRDYVHVMHVATAHIHAVEMLDTMTKPLICNLGTGKGTSVLELIATFEAVTGTSIPVTFATRREGEMAIAFADPSKAKAELNWQAERTVEEMRRHSWRWQQRYSGGFGAIDRE